MKPSISPRWFQTGFRLLLMTGVWNFMVG